MAALMIEHLTITPKSKDIIAMVIEREATKGYLHLTGRFPYRLAQGNQYVFVTYHVAANAILIKAIKNRESDEVTKAWEYTNNRLKKSNETPYLYIIDNEASKQLKVAMTKENIAY